MSVPAIIVLPVPPTTENLLVLTVRLPVAAIEVLELKELTVAEPDTSKVPFKSTFLPNCIFSPPLVVTNLM